jgi:hypothetical protein
LKLVCKVNIVNGNLKSENSQDSWRETLTKLYVHELGFRWSHRSSLGTILDEAEDELMDKSDEDEGGGQETEDLASTYEAGGDLWRDEVTRCAGHLPIEDTGIILLLKT